MSLAHQLLLLLQWVIARLTMVDRQGSDLDPDVVLMLLCDPEHMVGSRGDEAMLQSALWRIAGNGYSRVVAGSANTQADSIARSYGMEPVRVWGGRLMPLRFAALIRKARPSTALLMGADVMDGHYSPVVSLRMIIAADLLARAGVNTAYLGFSLNSDVPFLVRLAFRWLDRRVAVNLRDPLSFDRFTALTGRVGELVADTAFLLQPADLGAESVVAAEWIERQRQRSRIVIAVNFHPMLFSSDEAESKTKSLAENFAALIEGMRDLPISWLLLPHDDRVHAGDISSLALLDSLIDADLRENCHRMEIPPGAAEIKTLVKLVDGVVTGRMHLAIAALGQGVPVLTMAYQSKFEGLSRHFGLPEWVIVDPKRALEGQYLNDSVRRFHRELPKLRSIVGKHLPAVMRAAELTFARLR